MNILNSSDIHGEEELLIGNSMWYFLSYFTSIKLYDNFVCVGVLVKSVPSFTWMWKLCLSFWNPFKIHIINTFRVYSYVFLHICIYKYTNIYLGVLHTHGGVAGPSVWVFVSMYATRNNILVYVVYSIVAVFFFLAFCAIWCRRLFKNDFLWISCVRVLSIEWFQITRIVI